jgi:nitrogen-specific signal transduction histidine kinase/CheY-like chemotaxis protein
MHTIETEGRSAGVPEIFLNLAAPFEDGVLVWFIDVTAQKDAEQRLREQDRRKNEFLAMLAHELRNPLAPIRNANELLARLVPRQDERVSNAIEISRRQVKQLSRLVDDLLDVSRVTQGRIELQRRIVDISSLINHAVEAVQPLMREKHQKLSVTYSGEPTLYVDADPARMIQCVVNILTNAAKYSDPGGEIEIRTRADGQSVVIQVCDSGIGITPELLPRVFDLFVQGDRALDRSQGGLGVGLAVVKRLIEMHEGTIAAHSAGVGRGSTFEISLPRTERPAAAQTAPGDPRSAAARILVVDDNRDAADSLASLLRLEGHDTQTAYSGREVLEHAPLFKPHVVLLDIGLPGMDGYSVAQRLREMPELASTRLVAITGYGQPEDRLRAQEAGFHDHVIKPVSLARLNRSIGGQAEGNGGAASR